MVRDSTSNICRNGDRFDLVWSLIWRSLDEVGWRDVLATVRELAELKDLDDIRMVNLVDEARLLLEARQTIAVRRSPASEGPRRRSQQQPVAPEALDTLDSRETSDHTATLPVAMKP